MPSAQVIDLNYSPRTKQTQLESILGEFSEAALQKYNQNQETDALKEIYAQHTRDGDNIQNKIQAISSDPRIGPTARVNTINQLLEMQKYNHGLQKEAAAKLKSQQEAEVKKAQVRDIEKRYGLEENALSAYDNDPSMAARLGKPPKEPKENQADRPIKAEQQQNIDKVVSSPEWEKASIPQKQQLLLRGNVSKENITSVLNPIIAEKEISAKEKKYKDDREYQIHKDSAKFDEQIAKEANSARVQLDAIEEVEPAIENVNPYDIGSILRNFGETGKAISNAIASKDQAKIQAAVPAFLEGRKELFGIRLSDADLKLLQDKLPDVGKSQEANKAIIQTMKKYSRLAIAKEKVARKIKQESKGLRGIDYADRVAETFEELKKPVKIVTPPPQEKVISIPAFELEEAINSGAQLYNG